MKNRIGFVLVCACLMACTQRYGYKITADIAGMPDGLKVYLENRRQVLDSTFTSHGRFVFAGKAAAPFRADISIQTPGDGMFSARSFELFLENSDIRVEGRWADFYKMRITGSVLEDEYQSYRNRRDAVSDSLLKGLDEQYWNVYREPLYNNAFTADCIRQGMEIEKRRLAAYRELFRLDINFMEKHPDSPISLDILEKMLYSGSRFTNSELDAWINILTPELKRTDTYKSVEEKIAGYRVTAKGERFIDFPVEDMNGNRGMFSDYVQPGKYNMLEVWASWCGHCRAEIPHLKIVQERYGNRFNIIAVSVDKKDADWRKAMDEDRPNYLQLRAIKDENGQGVMERYGLKAIPYSLLVDGEGRIVGADESGAKLDLLMEEFYGE